mmetsp:Transcript_16877/g.41841  ORF Transcript_16877/g.41841 Transcript_16877/m.41841 type:complete len:224 (-) Transcript_16877:452-1123(-)
MKLILRIDLRRPLSFRRHRHWSSWRVTYGCRRYPAFGLECSHHCLEPNFGLGEGLPRGFFRRQHLLHVEEDQTSYPLRRVQRAQRRGFGDSCVARGLAWRGGRRDVELFFPIVHSYVVVVSRYVNHATAILQKFEDHENDVAGHRSSVAGLGERHLIHPAQQADVVDAGSRQRSAALQLDSQADRGARGGRRRGSAFLGRRLVPVVGAKACRQYAGGVLGVRH